MSDVRCPKCGWFKMWPTYHPAAPAPMCGHSTAANRTTA